MCDGARVRIVDPGRQCWGIERFEGSPSLEETVIAMCLMLFDEQLGDACDV